MCNPLHPEAERRGGGLVLRRHQAARRGANIPDDILPAYPGLVVREEAGERLTWGLPLRLKTMKPEAKPIPVNNVADLTKTM